VPFPALRATMFKTRDTYETTVANRRAVELAPRPHVRSEEVITSEKLRPQPYGLTSSGEGTAKMQTGETPHVGRP
jgi:hypothetical protein